MIIRKMLLNTWFKPFRHFSLITISVFLTLCFLIIPAIGADDPVATTVAGKVKGYVNTELGIFTFKGLHYGESTEGSWRFKPPRAIASWNGTKDAVTYGPTCPQLNLGILPEAETRNTSQEPPQNEDCLVLNVFTPGLQGQCPVMVWLHGGGFASGSGTLYDGTRLAKRGDIVVVTINHRLNVFGYLDLEDVGGKDFEGSGMAGMLDIELALKWVRNNIGAFGGDPNNVTIFGESGGGAKVSTLLAMPSSKGLFHKGIIESGPGIRGVPREEGTEIARNLMAKLNITDGRKLQGIPVEDLLGAISPRSEGPRVSGMRLSPVVDGKFLPVHPFDPVASPTAAGIPIIIGTNKDEALLFLGRDPKRDSLTEEELMERLKPMLGEKTNDVLAVYKSSRPNASPFDILVAISSENFRLGSITLAERQAAASSAPVYMYLFDFEINNRLKAAHAMEIAFVFSGATARGLSTRPETAQVETDMSEAWIAFARTGNPNYPGSPHWPAYTTKDRATMVFDAVSRAINDPRRRERLSWEGINRSRFGP